jgi:hypothetical protein
VVPFKSFLASHRKFLVFSSHNLGHQDAGWFLPELANGGDSLHVVSTKRYDSAAGLLTGPMTLYTVLHN